MPYSTSTTTSIQLSTMRGNASSACPQCGGLQCLCRPRFFAGQLLTEEDLNRLEQYIIEKNKLHNRYLHGWGVVCGLEVVCNACPGLVTVKSGYALSPCGEDIVVCNDDTFNICDLIKKCKDKQRRQSECEPPGFNNTNGCQEVPEEWILAIRYDEKPSRGITALRASTSSPCCSRCSCGGSSSCGCGCHAQTNGNGPMKNGYISSPKSASAQCEPTVTCEGYTYEVYKAPNTATRPGRKVDYGPLAARFSVCLECINAAIPQLPDLAHATTQQMFTWCCSLKASLQDFLVTNEIYDCQLVEKLAAFRCPDPGQFQTAQDYFNALENELLNPLRVEFILYCFCSALLPPCPDPVDDPRVPLATITVRKDNCQILKVCDWDRRKIAITLPNLEYWLSILPYGRQLLQCLNQFCCDPLSLREFLAGTTRNTAFANIANMFTSPVQNNDLPLLLELLSGLLRCAFTSGVSVNVPNMFETFIAGIAGQPAATATGTATATASRDEEINNLKAQLAELQNLMNQQQDLINKLNERLNEKQ